VGLAKALGLDIPLSLKQLELAVSQVQGNVDLKNMPNSKHLDLTVSHAQGNVDPTNMSNPRHLNLTIHEVRCIRSPRQHGFDKDARPKTLGLDS
jgi:hypothetical protein